MSNAITGCYIYTTLTFNIGRTNGKGWPYEFVVSLNKATGCGSCNRIVYDYLEIVPQTIHLFDESIGHETNFKQRITGISISMPGIHRLSAYWINSKGRITFADGIQRDFRIVDHSTGCINICVEHTAQGCCRAGSMVGDKISATGYIGDHSHGQSIVTAWHVV